MDSPLMSFDEPGLWKFDYDFVPKRARIFVNLHNNQWNTNFPLWQEGSWRSRVRLWVVRGGGAEEDLITPAWEAREPLLAAYADGGKGSLPPSREGITITRRGVLVTAFGADPYGDKTLLRLWEQSGMSGACEVKLPAGFKAVRAMPVNLRGEKSGEAIPVSNGTFSVHLHAFAPASFVFE
jgi:hypothetical protein